MSAKAKIAPQLMKRLEAYGPELEQILDAWESHQERWSKGRAEGQDANRQRAAESRGRWRAQYEVLRRERPTASFDTLVYDVYQWCGVVGIRVNGRQYSLSTIRRDLQKYTT